jgi:predicted O-methyltransferase YrrM
LTSSLNANQTRLASYEAEVQYYDENRELLRKSEHAQRLYWLVNTAIPQLKADIAEQIKAMALIKDAQEQYEKASLYAESVLKWGVAVVIGTYLAGSMIYAGDTLLDTIQSAFNMFGLPFKGGI